MIKCILIVLIATALLTVDAGWAEEPRGDSTLVLIGPDREYETPYLVYESGRAGPVVLLEAGIHGDETAGFVALEAMISRLRIHSGRLIVFPRMNRPACEQDVRFIHTDLNKIFPGDLDGPSYECALAREIYEMVGQRGVEYVLTLHESKMLHDPDRPGTFGQTFVYGVEEPPEYMAPWMAAVNQGLAGDEIFRPYYYPVPTSSTEIFVEHFGLKGGFCIETWREFDLDRRVALQQRVVTKFLDAIGFEYSLESD